MFAGIYTWNINGYIQTSIRRSSISSSRSLFFRSLHLFSLPLSKYSSYMMISIHLPPLYITDCKSFSLSLSYLDNVWNRNSCKYIYIYVINWVSTAKTKLLYSTVQWRINNLNSFKCSKYLAILSKDTCERTKMQTIEMSQEKDSHALACLVTLHVLIRKKFTNALLNSSNLNIFSAVRTVLNSKREWIH